MKESGRFMKTHPTHTIKNDGDKFGSRSHAHDYFAVRIPQQEKKSRKSAKHEERRNGR
jgi:hypothetical protein